MRILVVDDHRLFLEGLQGILADLYPQHEVVTFSSSRSAIDAIDAGEQFDMMLIDLLLPGLNGLDFLQSLKQRHIKSSVIVVSSSTEEQKIQFEKDSADVLVLSLNRAVAPVIQFGEEATAMFSLIVCLAP